MKANLYIVLIAGMIVLLAGCAKEEISQQRSYTIETMPPKVIEIAHENPNAWIESGAEHRQELNRIRNLRELNESDLDFKRMQEMKNVRSVVDGEQILGYDPETDNPDLKEVDE